MLPGLTPQMEAALRALDPIIVGLLEVNLPDYDLRLIDGASKLPWGDKMFLGSDPIYGKWLASDAFGDGIGDEVPALTVTLAPKAAATAGDLTAARVQGSPVRVWLAALDKATGGVVPDPILLFDGELDQPIIEGGLRTLSLDYDCVSAFERLFVDNEGIRLSDAHHQDVWPGETGLANVTGLVKTVIWGPGDRPPGIVTSSASSSQNYSDGEY